MIAETARADAPELVDEAEHDAAEAAGGRDGDGVVEPEPETTKMPKSAASGGRLSEPCCCCGGRGAAAGEADADVGDPERGEEAEHDAAEVGGLDRDGVGGGAGAGGSDAARQVPGRMSPQQPLLGT